MVSAQGGVFLRLALQYIDVALRASASQITVDADDAVVLLRDYDIAPDFVDGLLHRHLTVKCVGDCQFAVHGNLRVGKCREVVLMGKLIGCRFRAVAPTKGVDAEGQFFPDTGLEPTEFGHVARLTSGKEQKREQPRYEITTLHILVGLLQIVEQIDGSCLASDVEGGDILFHPC